MRDSRFESLPRKVVNLLGKTDQPLSRRFARRTTEGFGGKLFQQLGGISVFLPRSFRHGTGEESHIVFGWDPIFLVHRPANRHGIQTQRKGAYLLLIGRKWLQFQRELVGT